MSKTIGNCDVEGCELPCSATHNCQRRHGTEEYGGCKCVKHIYLGAKAWRRILAERREEK
jgi:hypothetical protein